MQLRMLEIIHAGAPQAAVVEDESAGLDHIDGQAETGRQAQDRTGILRDVRLIEREPHGEA